jgi:glyoxylase-like metal-dependent hydrolase (beta-lactamase superfamily II)
MILKSLVVGPIQSNCFIIGDDGTREGAVIDPGSDGDVVWRIIQELELDMKYIIATHGHFDHTAGIPELKKHLDCPFLMHRDDLFFVRTSRESALRWGFDIEQVPEPDRYLEEDGDLTLGGLRLEILHTPGHSPGGVSIYLKSENLLFAGDTLFCRSIGRTDLKMGSMADLTRSIREKLYILPDETAVYTGHGEPTTIGDEKRFNFFVPG